MRDLRGAGQALGSYQRHEHGRVAYRPRRPGRILGVPKNWTLAEPSACGPAEMELWRSRVGQHLSNFFGD